MYRLSVFSPQLVGGAAGGGSLVIGRHLPVLVPVLVQVAYGFI
jgi:hypothetical protein